MAQVQVSNKPWYKEVTKNQWRALIAASSGWALDAMDVMLYSMVLVHVMADLQMDKTTGGFFGNAYFVEFCRRRHIIRHGSRPIRAYQIINAKYFRLFDLYFPVRIF